MDTSEMVTTPAMVANVYSLRIAAKYSTGRLLGQPE